MLLFLIACTSTPTTTDSAPGQASDSGVLDTGPADSGQGGRVDCDDVDESPGATAQGHGLDGWNWTKSGALWADDGVAPYDGDMAPALAWVGDVLVLLFSRKVEHTMTLNRATWTVEQGWSAPQIVTGVPASSAVYPTLVSQPDALRMWVGSGSVDLYESADQGLTWTEVATSVLRAGDPGDLDAYGTLYPSVIATDSGYDMLYTGFDGAKFRIGAAHSADGETWEKSGVVLEPTTDGFDNASVAQPAMVATDAGVFAWYGGYDTIIANPGPWRVGLMHLDSGGGWARDGLSVPLAESGPDAWSTRDPAVVRDDAGWRMVYSGMGDDGVYRLMQAQSAVCP